MLKVYKLVKSLETEATESLRAFLHQIRAITLINVEQDVISPQPEIDIVAHIEVSGRRHTLICEVKSSGQPRYVRSAALQLRHSLAHYGQDTTPVLIAPYLSPEAQAICREHEVGFLDLEGNARLQFKTVYIERTVSSTPAVARRELKSLFKPKAAQILRVMLREPQRAWRVVELAQSADVSLGQVSNVRSGLLAREWAQVADDGLFLSAPDALLDAWRDAYDPPAGQRLSFYTALHGSSLEDAARTALDSGRDHGRAAFASFSAAHWLVPYARTGAQYFYADDTALKKLQNALQLSSVSKGENVLITQIKDPGVLRDTVEPVPGAICTSTVQTYLDLTASGERGREAADHLRQEKLRWTT